MNQKRQSKPAVIDALPIAIAAYKWFDGATSHKLYKMAKKGQLKLTKIDGRTYVTREEAERVNRNRPQFAPVVLP